MLKAVRMLLVVALVTVSVTALSAQNSKAVGTWTFTTQSPQGETTSTMIISEDAGKLKAVAKSERGERPYDSVAVDGSKITLVLTINFNGSPMVITYTGAIDGTKMGGEADFGGMATGTWSATSQK